MIALPYIEIVGSERFKKMLLSPFKIDYLVKTPLFTLWEAVDDKFINLDVTL